MDQARTVPVGLSLTTKLAPRVFQTQMVALFFLSVGAGTAAAGALAEYYDETHEFGYFGLLGLLAIVAGVVMTALRPVVRRLMSGVR